MANPNYVWDCTELCQHFDLLQFYTMPHIKTNSFCFARGPQLGKAVKRSNKFFSFGVKLIKQQQQHITMGQEFSLLL